MNGELRSKAEVKEALDILEQLLKSPTVRPEMKNMFRNQIFVLQWILKMNDWKFLVTAKGLIDAKRG